MPPAASIFAHSAYLEVWDQALASERGIRIKTPNPVDYRARLYHARAAQRRHNIKVYPEDHVMHGRSDYDNMVVKLEDGAVCIQKPEAVIAEIEEL